MRRIYLIGLILVGVVAVSLPVLARGEPAEPAPQP